MSRPTIALASVNRRLFRAGQVKITRPRVCLQGRRARSLSNKSCGSKDHPATLAVEDGSNPPPAATTWDEFRFRSGLTWLARDPTAVNPRSTLPMIQACRSEKPTRVQTIVLLVTPLLAHLLDPEVFLKPVMTCLYGDLRTETGTQELRVKSVAAVVDALPGPLSERGPPMSEGLAFLMSSAPPRIVSTDEADPVTLEFMSSGTHDTHSKSRRAVVRHLTLPVANTIFVNGNHATLLEDSWDITIRDSESVIAHQGRRSLKSCRVDMGCSGNDFLDGSIPLQSLTRPRKVVRSMGNVLAEIEIDGKAVPASRELEKAVTEYINANPTRASHGPFQVFAFVRPPRAAHSEGQDFTKADKHAGRILQGLWQDAKLFKVTGGGGGWGKKQGLLSLDTAVDFETVGATAGFPDLETTENLSHEIGSHGMIPRDGTVEFFLCSDGHVSRTRVEGSCAQDQNSAKRTPHPSTSFVLGTASDPEIQEFQDTIENEHMPGVSFYPNHFGMISYGGAALGSDETGEPEERDLASRFQSRKGSRTRLDVPNSFFVLQTLPNSRSSSTPTPTIACTPSGQA
ncbi:hypothetical protein A1O3_10358 [Capronia epimyces CBS 606.96]|uniref:Uncharacterized protein n=1 Tax=Capronia epimyces CBS 606.96 TaxID=1182542 RepID=W9XIL6_9EURO|nr:uncharacterized protein A1O3_10358 [Capronia epimyces CBS 606.96]EXJ77200.1 hypothetical protein A1O3_10358 [Capronia epimyces CBS 606.96]